MRTRGTVRVDVQEKGAAALVLVEPVPFGLLARAGRHDVYDDVCRLRDRVVEAAEAQRCAEAAPSVADH